MSNAPKTPGGGIIARRVSGVNRPAGDALDVGLQLDLASPAATTIVAHALYDITE
jgi:hypothetical protein